MDITDWALPPARCSLGWGQEPRFWGHLRALLGQDLGAARLGAAPPPTPLAAVGTRWQHPPAAGPLPALQSGAGWSLALPYPSLLLLGLSSAEDLGSLLWHASAPWNWGQAQRAHRLFQKQHMGLEVFSQLHLNLFCPQKILGLEAVLGRKRKGQPQAWLQDRLCRAEHFPLPLCWDRADSQA